MSYDIRDFSMQDALVRFTKEHCKARPSLRYETCDDLIKLESRLCLVGLKYKHYTQNVMFVCLDGDCVVYSDQGFYIGNYGREIVYGIALDELDLSLVDASQTYSFNRLFQKLSAKRINFCKGVNLTSWGIFMISTAHMFDDCNIGYIDMRGYNFNHIELCTQMLCNSRIEHLDLSDIDFIHANMMGGMFANSKIGILHIRDFVISGDAEYDSMFYLAEIERVYIHKKIERITYGETTLSMILEGKYKVCYDFHVGEIVYAD